MICYCYAFMYIMKLKKWAFWRCMGNMYMKGEARAWSHVHSQIYFPIYTPQRDYATSILKNLDLSIYSHHKSISLLINNNKHGASTNAHAVSKIPFIFFHLQQWEPTLTIEWQASSSASLEVYVSGSSKINYNSNHMSGVKFHWTWGLQK